MPQTPTWPPPPNTPEPLSAHDDFLAAAVRNSMSKVPLSRLHLVKDLHDETKLDLCSCSAFVSNFCDRHTILMPLHSLWAGLGCLLPLFNLLAVVGLVVVEVRLQQRYVGAATHPARRAIEAEQIEASFIFVGILVVSGAGIVIFSLWRDKKMAEQAAEARAKFV